MTLVNQRPYTHSWASASRQMPPASVFRHPASHSGTEHSDTGLGIRPICQYRCPPLLPSTLRVAESDTPSRPHSWWWKGKHPHVQRLSTLLTKLDCRRNTPSRPHCWLWKGIQLLVHTAVVEKNTPSCSHPACGG
jgi:hypothetical protein